MTPLSRIDRVVPHHLEDDALVAYLDGELQASERADASSHLEECWACRSRLAAVEGNIEAFLRTRRAVLPEELPPSAPAVAQFRARLVAHADQVVQGSRFQRQLVSVGLRVLEMLALPWSWRTRPALGLAMLAIVTIGSLIGWWTTPLSASDVLARAEVRELLDVRMADNVVTMLVQIDKIDQRTQHVQSIGTLETSQDHASSAISAIARHNRGGLFQEVFSYDEDLAARRYFRVELGEAFSAYAASRHWTPTVSVYGYLRLIGGRGHHGGAARRIAPAVIELQHSFAAAHPSGIRETRLLLDARTYAPAQISVFVVENTVTQEYRFRRLNLQFVTRSPKWAERFASVHTVTRPDRTPTFVPDLFDPQPVRRPWPLSYADSIATVEEVETVVALHASGADLGEEVNVFPMSDGSLLVQGLVETDARKTAIEQALAGVSGRLRVELYAPSDLTTSTELYDSPYGFFALPTTALSSASVRVIDFSGVKIPLYEQLRDYFGRARPGASQVAAEEIEREMTRFVTNVLERSDAALFHAWALRKLDLQFPTRRVAQLTANAVEQINQIRHDHRRAVAGSSRDLSRQLAAVMPDAIPATVGTGAAIKDLDAATVLRLSSQQRDLVRELFIQSVNAPDVRTALARLGAVWRRLG